MAQITTSGDFSVHRRLVFFKALVRMWSFCLALALAPRSEARAASISPAPDLSAEVVGRPFVLDQNGHLVVTSGKGKSHTLELAPGSVPSYLAYRLHQGATIPSSVPTVDAGSGGKPQFTPLVQAQLNEDITKNGEAVVSSGKRSFLVQPLPVVFGASPGTSASRGTNQAWRAALSTLRKNLASSSASGTTASTGSGTSASPSTAGRTTSSSVPTTVQAQTIIPSRILDPAAHSKLIKDMGHLLTIRSGRFINWDQPTFNALKSDLSLGSPKNVAPKVSATSTAKPVYEAQVIAGFGGTATSPQPVPAPEPGTLAIFGLGAIALVSRLRRGS